MIIPFYRAEKDLIKHETDSESILGYIHLNLAVYHEACRSQKNILSSTFSSLLEEKKNTNIFYH
jgi:hypothetical protein